jgi:queuine tRNA-ribosyltransferase
LFGIVQGGMFEDLRDASLGALREIGFEGYAIGGLSVGEPKEEMQRVEVYVAPRLPAEAPRYLMGVGTPEDIVAAVGNGIDMFDCVLPTRNGRNAMAFTSQGTLRLRNACYKRDQAPLESDCACTTCRHFSRAYVHHLFLADEMLGPTLLSLHNLAYYVRLLGEARLAIRERRFADFCTLSLARLAGKF